MTRRMCILIVAMLGTTLIPAAKGFELTDSDRVVFYGSQADNVPMIGLHVEKFVRIRYPELKVRFWHAGPRGRATAQTGLADFDAVAGELAPTVVVLAFGSADIAGRPFDQAKYSEFITAMGELTDRCMSMGARVYLLTPPRPEIKQKKLLSTTAYDVTVRRYCDGLVELAAKKGAQVFDWNAAMDDYVSKRQDRQPPVSLMRKGVTPNAEAVAVAVDTILSQWQAEPIVVNIQADWTSLQVDSIGCTVRATVKTDAQLILELRGVPIPWSADRRVNLLKSEWPVRRYCRLILTVANAPDGKLSLGVSRETATWKVTGEQLRAGYDLASGSPLFDTDQTKTLFSVIGNKNRAHQSLMAFDRTSLKKPPPEPELKKAYALHRQMWREYNQGWSEVVARTPRRIDTTIVIKLESAIEKPISDARSDP